jgi:hypothetical protein
MPLFNRRQSHRKATGKDQSLGLVVGYPLPADRPELLNELEEAYRRGGHCPVIMQDDDEQTGVYSLGNPEAFRVAMRLPPDAPDPTLEDAEAFMREWGRLGRDPTRGPGT